MDRAPATSTFAVTPETRKLIEALSGDLGASMGKVAVNALEHYRGLLEAGSAEKPADNRLPARRGSQRVIFTGQPELAEWLGTVSGEWNASRALVLEKAVGYYAAAVESGSVLRAARSRKPSAKPKPEPETFRAGTPALRDRALCGTCGKQARVDPSTSLLAPHIAHPSVRPKGVFMNCKGSGQSPAGQIVHSAEIRLGARLT